MITHYPKKNDTYQFLQEQIQRIQKENPRLSEFEALLKMASSNVEIYTPITNKYVFKKIFADTTLLKGFLSSILPLHDEIQRLEIIQSRTPLKRRGEVSVLNIKIQMDVRMILKSGITVIGDLNLSLNNDWNDWRILCGCALTLEGIETGYETCNIEICKPTTIPTKDLLDPPGYFHEFVYMDTHTQQFGSENIRIYEFELKNLPVASPAEQWNNHYHWGKLFAATSWAEISEIDSRIPGISRAKELLLEISRDKISRYLYTKSHLETQVEQYYLDKKRNVR